MATLFDALALIALPWPPPACAAQSLPAAQRPATISPLCTPLQGGTVGRCQMPPLPLPPRDLPVPPIPGPPAAPVLICFPSLPPAVKISTGCQALDELLGGGVETKAVRQRRCGAGRKGMGEAAVDAGLGQRGMCSAACSDHRRTEKHQPPLPSPSSSPSPAPPPPFLPHRSPRCLVSGAPARRSCATPSASPAR